jgi:hypothetical protein
VRDPGGADPGQQADMALVLGQDHRTVGQRGKGGLDVDDDLVGVGARPAAEPPSRLL